MTYIIRGTNAIGLVRSYKRPTPSPIYDSSHKRLLRSIFRMYDGNSLPYFWSNFRLRKRTFGDCGDKYCCCRTGVKMMYRRCLLLLMRWSVTAVVPVVRPLPDSWSRATNDCRPAAVVGVVLEVVVATRQVIAIKHSAGNAR